MFLLVYVCPLTGGSHAAISHGALGLTVQGSMDIRPLQPIPLDISYGTPQPTASDIWWPLLET